MSNTISMRHKDYEGRRPHSGDLRFEGLSQGLRTVGCLRCTILFKYGYQEEQIPKL